MAGRGRPACTGTVAGAGLRRPPEGGRGQGFDPERRIAYGGAKAAADGVIAGLTVALVQGGNPADLPKMNANLEKAGAGLQEVCNDAISAAKASEGRGIVDEAVKAAVGPVVDALKAAAGALWTRHVEKDDLEIETIKGQLDAAKWPDFGP